MFIKHAHCPQLTTLERCISIQPSASAAACWLLINEDYDGPFVLPGMQTLNEL